MNYRKHKQFNFCLCFHYYITTAEAGQNRENRLHNLNKNVYHAHYLPTAASLTANLHVLHNPIGFRDTVAGLIAWIIRLKQLCTSITTLTTTGTNIEEEKKSERKLIIPPRSLAEIGVELTFFQLIQFQILATWFNHSIQWYCTFSEIN